MGKTRKCVWVVVVAALLIVGILLAPSCLKRRISFGPHDYTVALLDSGVQMYYADHKQYPPSEPVQIDGETWYGRHRLAQALTGFRKDDGAEGWGFRFVPGGHVYGPYPKGIEKKLGEAESGKTGRCFRDMYGNPVYYYRYDVATDSYHSSDNPDGPDLDKYFRDLGYDQLPRRNFLLMTKGKNGRWDANPQTDDLTNFLN